MSDSVVDKLKFYLIKFGLSSDKYTDDRYKKSFFGTYRKFVLVSARLFHAVHYTLCLVAIFNGFTPKYLFDIYRNPFFDMGTKMFLYIILMTYNLFFAGVLYLFNFSPKSNNHWITILRELVYSRSTSLTNKIKQKSISRVKLVLQLLPICSMSMNIAIIAFYLPLMLITYNGTDFIIYGVPSFVLIFNSIRPLVPLGILFSLNLLIVIEYVYKRFKYLNLRLKDMLKNAAINSSLIIKLNVEHNIICKRIYSYNQFWKNVYLLLLLTIMPCNLFIFHQLIFFKLNNPLLYCIIVIATVETVGLSSLLVIASALMYRESKKVGKYLIKFSTNHSIKLYQRIVVSY